jgi:hypothetical protein
MGRPRHRFRHSFATALTDEQRAALELWLADPNLTLAQVREHVLAKFGIKVQLTTLGRYMKHRAISNALPPTKRQVNGFEISVIAPGATEIRVSVRPLE